MANDHPNMRRGPVSFRVILCELAYSMCWVEDVASLREGRAESRDLRYQQKEHLRMAAEEEHIGRRGQQQSAARTLPCATTPREGTQRHQIAFGTADTFPFAALLWNASPLLQPGVRRS